MALKLPDRVFIGDLDAETKMFRHLRTQSADPFFTREMIKAGIHANRRKCLRIFRKAFAFEFCLQKFAAGQIPLLVVHRGSPLAWNSYAFVPSWR